MAWGIVNADNFVNDTKKDEEYDEWAPLLQDLKNREKPKLFDGIDDTEEWTSYSVETKPHPTLDDILKKCEAWRPPIDVIIKIMKRKPKVSIDTIVKKLKKKKKREELIKFIHFMEKLIAENKKKREERKKKREERKMEKIKERKMKIVAKREKEIVDAIKIELLTRNTPPPKKSFLKQMEMFYEKHC